MRARCGVLVLACLLGAVVAADPSVAPAPSDEYLGTWTGTWEGSGSGGFELTLEKGADGALRGSVSVTGRADLQGHADDSGPRGRSADRHLRLHPRQWAEVALEATFDGNAASGTWVLREKASGSEAARGTWSVKRT